MRNLTSFFLCGLLLAPVASHATEQPLDRIAVVVDESVILENEVRQRMADAEFNLHKNNTPLPPESILRQQVIEHMILDSLQMQMADRAGIKIDDDTINAAVKDIATQNKMTLDEFRKQLDNTPGSSYAAVRRQIQEELTINRLRQRRISERVRITEQDVLAFLKSPQGQEALATEYHLAHILIALPENPSSDDLQKAQQKADSLYQQVKAGANFQELAAANSQADTALNGGDLGWRKAAQLPTLFADQVAKMHSGDIAPPIRTPGGIHIVKVLERRGTDEHIVHQIHVRHILIKPSEILSVEEAKEKIGALHERLTKGADFAELARLYSEDPGSARNGGDLGWVSPGIMVPEFEQQMNTVKDNAVSPAFQSKFGWHILQVLGRRDQDMSDDYRQELARRALFERQYDQELQAWLRELRAGAYVDIKKHD